MILVSLGWPHQGLSSDNKIMNQFEKKVFSKKSPAIIGDLVIFLS